MINLLPQKDKRDINRTIFFRRLFIIFVILNILLFIYIILLFPAFVTISSKESVVNKEFNSLKSSESFTIDQDMNTIIDDTNTKLKIFPDFMRNDTVSEKIFSALLKEKIDSINITHISYTKSEKIDSVSPNIQVSGKANSREALFSYAKKLENNGTFSSVDVPISDFVKGKNIEFIIQLKINTL